MTILGRNRCVSSSPARALDGCEGGPARPVAKGAAARRKARRQEFQRRALLAEPLEARAMLDGNGLNLVRYPFWNINQPRDVNADGMVTAFDALRIINDLNVRGARSLATEGAGASGGEREGVPQQGFIDVNNDNRITAMDALQVINRLNSGGEGDPLIKLTVQVVASGTNNDITTISKGGFYEVRVLAEDLGVLMYMGETRPATNVDGETLLGVATTFFDLKYPTARTNYQVNEVQNINIANGVNNGSFKLTVNDNGTLKTTGDITFAANRDTVTFNIQTALNTLLGNNVVEVTRGSGSTNWRVRFINRLADRDMPEITGMPNGSLGGSATITVTEVIKGLPTNPAAVSDALRNPRVFYDADGNALNDDPPFFPEQRAGADADPLVDGFTGIDDVGGSELLEPYQGTAPTEVLRLRMNAIDAGVVNFDLSLDDIREGLETGLLGFGVPVTTDLITIMDDSITITEPLTAGPDFGNTTEGSTTPIDIIVTTNDVNNPPTPSTTKSVVSVDNTGALGSAVVLNSTTIRYTPPGGDVNGTDVIRYTVTDQAGNTDIGTVTITIAAVNDAPNVNGPTSQTFNEEVTRVFSSLNGNAITISDVDVGANNLMTLTLNVGAGNGNLLLGSTAGLVGLTGNGTSTITTQGTLANLNAALENLSFTPATNVNGTVILEVDVNDNGHTGGPAQPGSRDIVLNITAVNDAPVVSLAGYTITPVVDEGEPLVLNAANNTRLAVSDVDSGTNPVVVTLSVTAGNTINVPTVPGTVTIDAGTNNTNNVVLRGPVADINTALNGIIYTAAVGFGPDNESLQITINDQGNTGLGGPLNDSETVTITVEAAVRPRARNDSLTVDEDSTGGLANTVDVLYGGTPDLVNDGSLPRLISFDTTSLQGGTIALDDGGTPADDTDDKLIYTPPADYSGPDSFDYVMDDTSGLGVPDTGTVFVTVREMNDPPVATDDPLSSIAEDSGDRIILANDLTGNDIEGPPSESSQTLTITNVGSAVGGTVAINGAGNVVFTPTPNYAGPASFVYTITDNGQTNGVNDFKTDTATVTFTITEVNDQPIADPSPLTLPAIDEDSGDRTIPFTTLLAGDTPGGGADEASQIVTVQSVANGTGGTVAIVGTDVIFTPQANFHGTASFTYTIVDNGTTNGVADPLTRTTTVNFPVNPVNDQPDADDDIAPNTGEGQSVDIAVLANDSDVDASATFIPVEGTVSPGTTISIVTPPLAAQGTAVVVGNVIRFTPAAGFFGNYSFTYQLNDNSGAANQLSEIATVNGTVVERNDPPVVADDPGIVTNEDNAVAIDVLANDTDPDTAKANWSFILVTPPQNGTAIFNTTTRQVDYTPNPNFNGTDSFVYRVNDQSPINPQNLDSLNTALVSITVREVNDVPVANADPATGEFVVIADRDREFTAASLLANDSPGLPANESGQSITLTGVSATSANGGSVTLNGGVVTYTPLPGFTGTDSFTYTITDNGTTAGAADPRTAEGTVNVRVVSFIPTDVVGYVYVDANNNGVFDPNERPLGGVDVTLTGTSDISGLPITPITKTTNLDGYYEFLDVEPGNYTLTETQPFALRDGLETAGAAGSVGANNEIDLILPLLGIAGEISFNYFGELGVDTTQLTNSAGLVSELLASSTGTGFVLAATLQGDMFWSWALNGWNGTASIKVTLDADLSAATLEVSDGTTTYAPLRIFQNPYDTRNANRFNTDPVARLARFRLLGNDANGNWIIRLDGTAEHFFGVGTPLAAAEAIPSGEAGNAGEFIEGVDAAMAEWA